MQIMRNSHGIPVCVSPHHTFPRPNMRRAHVQEMGECLTLDCLHPGLVRFGDRVWCEDCYGKILLHIERRSFVKGLACAAIVGGLIVLAHYFLLSGLDALADVLLG